MHRTMKATRSWMKPSSLRKAARSLNRKRCTKTSTSASSAEERGIPMARITMREAISQALWEEMERDPKVFIMGEEVGVWGGTYAVTKGCYDYFGGERVRDAASAEAAIVGADNGAARTGARPVAELMTIHFAFVAMDHIVNEAA